MANIIYPYDKCYTIEPSSIRNFFIVAIIPLLLLVMLSSNALAVTDDFNDGDISDWSFGAGSGSISAISGYVQWSFWGGGVSGSYSNYMTKPETGLYTFYSAKLRFNTTSGTISGDCSSDSTSQSYSAFYYQRNASASNYFEVCYNNALSGYYVYANQPSFTPIKISSSYLDSGWVTVSVNINTISSTATTTVYANNGSIIGSQNHPFVNITNPTEQRFTGRTYNTQTPYAYAYIDDIISNYITPPQSYSLSVDKGLYTACNNIYVTYNAPQTGGLITLEHANEIYRSFTVYGSGILSIPSLNYSAPGTNLSSFFNTTSWGVVLYSQPDNYILAFSLFNINYNNCSSSTLPPINNSFGNGSNNGNFSGSSSTGNASGWSSGIGNITGQITGISQGIGNITSLANNLSGEVSSYNYSKHTPILITLMGVALPLIPLNIKLELLFVVVLVGVLMIMNR